MHKKKKTIDVQIFWVKSCPIMTFMILLKPNVLEKFGSQVKCKNSNQVAGFLNFNVSKTIGGIKLIFCMQVHIY